MTRDLRMALTEGVDWAIFLGDGGDRHGCRHNRLANGGHHRADLDPSEQGLGPGTLAAFTGLVDGIHAMSLGDLKVVAAVGAWRLWENTIINSTADNQTLGAFLRMAGLMWSARGEIETDTANGDFGAFIGRGMGLDGTGVAAVWEAGELIRDPYSGAAKGEVALNPLLSVGLRLATSGQLRPH